VDLGWHFGASLYEAEVRYLMANEFARTVDDILWRRTKLGLHISAAGRQALAVWLETHGPS
jgi:glycerol-3-phosphate dehydrogenase